MRREERVPYGNDVCVVGGADGEQNAGRLDEQEVVDDLVAAQREVGLERAAEQLVEVQVAVDVAHAELVAVRVEHELGDLGRRGLVALLVRVERVAAAPVPELDHALARAAQI